MLLIVVFIAPTLFTHLLRHLQPSSHVNAETFCLFYLFFIFLQNKSISVRLDGEPFLNSNFEVFTKFHNCI